MIVNQPPPEATCYILSITRTPTGVRGYGKICFLTEALRNTYNGKLLGLYFRNFD